jgi:biopolymer transport protein TolQ
VLGLTEHRACATVFFRAILTLLLRGPTIPHLVSFVLAGRLFTLLEQTGWVARIVLLLLLFFSLLSWAIILQKSHIFGRIEPQTRKFLQVFRSGRDLPDPRTMRVAAAGSPLVQVYEAGFRVLQSQITAGNPHAGKLKSANAIQVEMQLASAEEVRRLEKWMPWLATTGSVSPFIGLFGTVWGVMDAFAGLGEAGSASLRAVAPGIAEALVTTAAGLFTAIPAVIAYNHYLQDIRSFAARMDNFAMEVAAKIEMLYN